MKRLLPALIALAAALCLTSCADVSIPVTAQADAPANARFRLYAGADLDQAQVIYPGGPSIALAGLKTSPGMQMITNTVGDGVRWMGMGGLAKSFFKAKTAAAAQTARTARAKIAADATTAQAKTAAAAATRQAELQLLAPAASAAVP